MSRVELQSKQLLEVVNITVDFISRLASGELITLALCTCSVYSGTDPSPSNMVTAGATISGSKVTQQVQAGVLGNIYELTFEAGTSQGQTLQLSGYFAVVPDLP